MGNFVSFKTKYSSFVDSFFARFQNNTRMILVLLSRPRVSSAPQNFTVNTCLSSPCFQLLEFQLARIHFNCSPRSKLRGRSTAVQLIPFGAETHRASPPTKSDPLPYLFQAWTILEPTLRAWFWDRAFSSSVARLSTSLLYLRNGVNRVWRGASQAVSPWPRCRVSRVPRV